MTTPDTPIDVTLGEVYRNIETLRAETKAAFDRLSFVPTAQYESERADFSRRLGSLESARSWIIRTSVAAILTGAFSAFFLIGHPV